MTLPIEQLASSEQFIVNFKKVVVSLHAKYYAFNADIVDTKLRTEFRAKKVELLDMLDKVAIFFVQHSQPIYQSDLENLGKHVKNNDLSEALKSLSVILHYEISSFSQKKATPASSDLKNFWLHIQAWTRQSSFCLEQLITMEQKNNRIQLHKDMAVARKTHLRRK